MEFAALANVILTNRPEIQDSSQIVEDCQQEPGNELEPDDQGLWTGISVDSVNTLKSMNTDDQGEPYEEFKLVKFLFFECKETQTFKCVVCSVKFNTLDGLYSHYVMHSGRELGSKPALVVNDCTSCPTHSSALKTNGSSGKNPVSSKNHIPAVIKKVPQFKNTDSPKSDSTITESKEIDPNPVKRIVLLNPVGAGQGGIVEEKSSDLREVYCVIQTDSSSKHNIGATAIGYPEKDHPVTTKQKLMCMKCNKIFSKKNNLLQHYRTTHLKLGTATLEQCQSNLLEVNKGSNSIEVDHNAEAKKCMGEFACKECDKTFPRKHSLLRHTNTMSCLGNVNRPACPSCGKSFARKASLIRHYKRCSDNPDLGLLDVMETMKLPVATPGVKKLKCLACEQWFSDKETLSHHLSVVHELSIDGNCFTNKGSLMCPVCGKGFVRSGDLRIHVKYVHLQQRRPAKITCPVCNKKLKHSLEEHMRTHTGERPFMCETCGQLFSHKGALKIHLRTHTGEKPYKCDKCDKEFSCYAGLFNHEGVHTGRNTCNICGLTYSHYRGLQKHKNLKHKPFSGGSSLYQL